MAFDNGEKIWYAHIVNESGWRGANRKRSANGAGKIGERT
jgi:hypothetical protein